MRIILSLCVVAIATTGLVAQAIPATMWAVLREDSANGDDAYFYRINKVKTVTEEAEDEKEVFELDQYGHVLKFTSWDGGELFYTQEFTYNKFGHSVTRKSKFYDAGNVLSSLFESTVTYELDPSGLSEHAVKEVGKDTHYENGEKKSEGHSVTTFVYDSNGRLTKENETGALGYCPGGPKKYHRTREHFYTPEGYLSKHIYITHDGCDRGEENETTTYIYDSLGREIKATDMVDGKPDGITVTTYTATGKDESWTFFDEAGVQYMYFKFTYNEKDLKRKCKSTSDGEVDHSEFTYTYY